MGTSYSFMVEGRYIPQRCSLPGDLLQMSSECRAYDIVILTPILYSMSIK